MSMFIAILVIFSGVQLYGWFWDYKNAANKRTFFSWSRFRQPITLGLMICLLYTSDAADD